jgi:hypothetical protein
MSSFCHANHGSSFDSNSFLHLFIFMCSRSRCKFIQYMPNKPDKFGIKSWLLCEVDSKYICNAIPYLGKDDDRPSDTLLCEHVVFSLVEPYQNKGYCITADNFFTTVKLATSLLTSYWRTIKQRSESTLSIKHLLGVGLSRYFIILLICQLSIRGFCFAWSIGSKFLVETLSFSWSKRYVFWMKFHWKHTTWIPDPQWPAHWIVQQLQSDCVFLLPIYLLHQERVK